MKKEIKNTIRVVGGLLLFFALSIQAGRLVYYDEPRMDIISKKVSVDDYQAKYVYKLYSVDDREYFQKIKIEEISQRSGLLVKVLKRDTLSREFWYKKRQ